MNMRNWPGVIAGSIVVGALAAAFVLTQGGAGQIPASKTGLTAVALPVNDAAPAVQQAIAPAPAAPSSGEAAPSGPGVEGIKVSGHWTIEVRELDGRVVSRQEFENALQPAGSEDLARFLGRNATPGLFRVYLDSTSGNRPCSYGASDANCLIAESADTANLTAEPYLVKNLQVTLTSDFKVRLSGTVTAQRNGNISNVGTYVLRCASSNAPSSPCTNGSWDPLTHKVLTTPVSVLLNQQVAVTVDISFN